MGDVSLGRSYEEVTSAINAMAGALTGMVAKIDISYPRLGEATSAVQRDLDMALCLEPGKINEEFDRVRKVAMAVGEDAELVVNVDAAVNHVSGWRGDAADAFRGHMTRMKSFATDTQHGALLVALQSIGELFSMAFHMRQSYYDLAILVRSAAEHELDEEKERVDKAKLAIGKEFVKGVLTFDPNSIKTVAVDFAVESVGALVEYGIEGNGIDAVITSYLQGSNKLWQTFQTNLQSLAKVVRDEHSKQDGMELQILKPINQVSNGLTDVGSPNFSYANFYTEEYPKDGPFAGRLAEERTKYAEEKRHRDSEINRRLEDRS